MARFLEIGEVYGYIIICDTGEWEYKEILILTSVFTCIKLIMYVVKMSFFGKFIKTIEYKKEKKKKIHSLVFLLKHFSNLLSSGVCYLSCWKVPHQLWTINHMRVRCVITSIPRYKVIKPTEGSLFLTILPCHGCQTNTTSHFINNNYLNSSPFLLLCISLIHI